MTKAQLKHTKAKEKKGGILLGTELASGLTTKRLELLSLVLPISRLCFLLFLVLSMLRHTSCGGRVAGSNPRVNEHPVLLSIFQECWAYLAKVIIS